jgi:hypothetical protein
MGSIFIGIVILAAVLFALFGGQVRWKDRFSALWVWMAMFVFGGTDADVRGRF